MVSSKSHMKTLSVFDSGDVGETVLVRLPRPRVRVSLPKLLDDSLERLALSAFRGVELSVSEMLFEGLSESAPVAN